MRTIIRNKWLKIAILVPAMALMFLNCATYSHSAPIFANGAMRVQQHELLGVRYFEVTPRAVDPREELPTVVYFHGRASRPDIPSRPVADVPFGYRTILPVAPLAEKDGHSWFLASGAHGESRALAEGLMSRGEELAQWIESLHERHEMRGKPIVSGFSQGAELTLTLALHHPEVMSAALPVSGYIPPSIVPAEREPALAHPRVRALHGGRDPLLRIGRTREIVDMLQERGFDVELREVPDARHEVSPRMKRIFRGWLGSALLRSWYGSESDLSV